VPGESVLRRTLTQPASVRCGGRGYQNGGPLFAGLSPRLSLFSDQLRTVLAVKGSLRRTHPSADSADVGQDSVSSGVLTHFKRNYCPTWTGICTHPGAALMQALPSGDAIIMGHVRDAEALALWRTLRAA
jgi:hypothetical protein